MDTLVLNLNISSDENSTEIDGILFKKFAYVNIKLNDINVLNDDVFGNGFVVFEELKKSFLNDGKFLIFTSISGIADDGGWEYVTVENTPNLVRWYLNRDGLQYEFFFDKNKYIQEIFKIENLISKLNKNLTVEPKYIIYPE